MSQIKIQSIEEIDKYKDVLKNIKVWVCSTATGKSYLCSLDDRFFDLDAYQGDLTFKKEENVEKKTIEKMHELVKEGKIVTQASHGYFMEYLHKNNIPFVFLYGKPEVQEEYCERMLHRGSGMEFVKKFGVGIAERYYNKTNDERPTVKIELSSKEYAKDYFWKVFGAAKKFIQCKKIDKNELKIAFIDLDCTLLDPNGELTDFTIKTIKKMQKKIKIVITSGRSADSVKPVLDQLGLNSKDCYAICACGAIVIDGKGKVVSLNNISEKLIYLFIKSFDKKFLDCCYFNTFSGRKNLKDISDLEKFLKTNSIYKIVYGSDEVPSIPKEISSKFYLYGNPTFIEFVNKDCTKDKAIAKLVKENNLTLKNAIAFGDGESDLNMLKKAGCGIAVANADWSIKHSAKYITDSNNEDGVAKALIKIFD